MRSFACITLLCVLISGCAAITPRSIFPEFTDRVKGNEKINIILDATAWSDIEGSDVGFNKEKNEKLLTEAESAISSALTSRGYQPNFIYTGNGLSFVKEDEVKYFYSENWKSTEVEYDGPHIGVGAEQWSSDITSFLNSLVSVAKGTHAIKNGDTGESREVILLPNIDASGAVSNPLSNVPAGINNNSSDLLMYVKIEGGEINKGKTYGTAFLTAAISAALSGGMYVYTSTAMSASQIEIITLDMTTKEVVWYNSKKGPDISKVGKAIENALYYYPNVEGEYIFSLGSKAKKGLQKQSS